MISSVTNASLFSSATGTGSTSGTSTLDKDAFMTLLITQLKNQDPMNPSDASQLAAQLAQFTTVEQLTSLNDIATSGVLSVQEAALLSKTALSTSLIGKTVVTADDQVSIPTTGSGRIRLDVGTGGGDAELQLLDDNGQVVATRALGRLSGGRQTITLPDDLPTGDYHYAVTVTNSAGTKVDVTTYTIGTVDGISFRNGSIVLRVGDMEIEIDDLAEVEPE